MRDVAAIHCHSGRLDQPARGGGPGLQEGGGQEQERRDNFWLSSHRRPPHPSSHRHRAAAMLVIPWGGLCVPVRVCPHTLTNVNHVLSHIGGS